MRAFNLLLFFILVLALVLVVGVALTKAGGITLGGYPGPSQPQRIQPPQPNFP